jgi:signal transduction histidine kinase
LNLKHLVEHLNGKDAFRFSAFLVRSPLFIFFTLVTFAGDPAHKMVNLVLAATFGSFTEFLVILWARSVLAGVQITSIWPIWFVYWIAGEISGVVLLLSMDVPFVEPGNGVSAWVILVFNGFLAVVWFTASNLATGLLAKDITLLRELSRKTTVLEVLQLEAESRLREEISELKETISGKVLELLERITKQLRNLTSNTSNAELLQNAQQVRDLCESEVRALSHSVASKTFEPPNEVVSLPKVLSPWGSSRAKASDIKLRLRWVAAIGIFNALAIALQRGGWLTALAALALIAIGILAIRALDRLRIRVVKTESVSATVVLVAFEYLSMSVVAMLILWMLGFHHPEIARFVSAVYVTVPMVLVIIWLLVQLIQDSARRLRDYGRDLSEKQVMLERTLADIERQSTRARRRLGQFLHGSIQGRLASVSMALTVAAKTSSSDLLDELLLQARNQLELSALEVNQVLQGAESRASLSLADEIQQLKDGWKNLVELTFSVSDEAVRCLEVRSGLTDLVVEAMQECITNAVRHGQAKRVNVQIGLDPNLFLKVKNDGLPIEKLTPGFGITSILTRAKGLKVTREDSWSVVSLNWANEPDRAE